MIYWDDLPVQGRRSHAPCLHHSCAVFALQLALAPCFKMTAARAKLSLIPATNPPGPLCQIKHLTAASVPLTAQKDIWRLKLGNWKDDGSFLCCLSNRKYLHLSLSLSVCLSSLSSLTSLSHPLLFSNCPSWFLLSFSSYLFLLLSASCFMTIYIFRDSFPFLLC